jgi:hypothetical protein
MSSLLIWQASRARKPEIGLLQRRLDISLYSEPLFLYTHCAIL